MIGVGLGAKIAKSPRIFGPSEEWSIASLPASTIILDVSKSDSLYNPASGTTLASVGQTVGLMLDARSTVGAEILTNGDFSAGATGWSVPAGWAISGGVATATATGGSLLSGSAITAKKFYKISFTFTRTSGTLYVRIGTGTPVTFTTSGTFSCIIYAVDTRGLEFYGGSVTGVLDNISIKEVSGHHAIQTAAPTAPALMQDAEGRPYLAFVNVHSMELPSAKGFIRNVPGAWLVAAVDIKSQSSASRYVFIAFDNIGSNARFSFSGVNPAGNSSLGVRRVDAEAEKAVGAAYASGKQVLSGWVDCVEEDAYLLRGNTIIAQSTDLDFLSGGGNFPDTDSYAVRINNTSSVLNMDLYALAFGYGYISDTDLQKTIAWAAEKIGIGATWTPAQLPGNPIIYDMSRTDLLFENSAGSIPAATTHTVGLIMDSKGAVGSEILANFDFSSGITGWTTVGTVTAASGICRIVSSGEYAEVSQNNRMVIGKWYRVRIVFGAGTTGAMNIAYMLDGTSADTTYNGHQFNTSPGVFEFTLRATNTAFLIKRAGAVDLYIDSISLKEISGHHAVQTSGAAAPALMQDAGGKPYLAFVGDDALSLPSAGGVWRNVSYFYGVFALDLGAQTPGANNQLFRVFTANSASSRIVVQMADSGGSLIVYAKPGADSLSSVYKSASPVTGKQVFTVYLDLVNHKLALRRNGVLLNANTTISNTQTIWDDTDSPGVEFSSIVSSLEGKAYYMALGNTELSDTDISRLENYAATKMGITL